MWSPPSGQRPHRRRAAVWILPAGRHDDLFDLRPLGPAVISRLTGKSCCHACLQRRARCSSCGMVKPIRGGSLTEPVCAACTRPGAWGHACPGCGEHSQHRRRRCGRCSLRARLATLLDDGTGQVQPRLRALHDHLAAHERPDTVLAWLNKDTASSILGEIACGERELTHAGLDELPDSKPLRHLRSVLVATGALPARDEHLVRLERWITGTLAERGDPEQRALLRSYAIWHQLRRLRGRNKTKPATHAQVVVVQQHVRAAITLLDWLTAHGRTLATATQNDLDTWLTGEHIKHRREAGHFVRWAKHQKLTSLDFAAIRWDGPTRPIDTQARWDHARRLLHEPGIDTADRVAGLLVLLYAQWPATISRLTLDHIHTDEDKVLLRLGREPIVLPEPPRRADSRARCLPPRPRQPGRPRNLPLAVSRRTARPAHQCRAPRRTTAPTRAPARTRSIDSAFRPGNRTARRHARPTPRHPHRCRRGLATSQQRRLGQLRRRLQPPRTDPAAGPLAPRSDPGMTGIRTVRIPDSTRASVRTGSGRPAEPLDEPVTRATRRHADREPRGHSVTRPLTTQSDPAGVLPADRFPSWTSVTLTGTLRCAPRRPPRCGH